MSDQVTLYLRPGTRALAVIAPKGAPLPAADIAGTVQVDVSREQWATYDAFRQALPAGQDLVIALDGSASAAPHVPSQEEQVLTSHRGAIRAFVNNPTPTAEIKDAALRAVIRHLSLDA